MRKVLVVDDDHLVRRGFIGMMPWSRHGFEVIAESNNGEKALSSLELAPVDLIITDLAMPVMSGIELMKKVTELYPRTAMVVLTFHHDFELIQEALRLGAIDYITKVELEHEQMDGILKRIAARMDQQAQQSQPAPEAASEPKLAAAGEDDAPYSKEVLTCIRNAISFIRSEFQNEIYLTDVARRVNMSRSYFSRCFRDVAGKTFNDFVRETRIEHSKELLVRTNKPVQWIAVQSGFPNEKYFFKVFRMLTGMLPREFRNSHSSQSAPASLFQVNIMEINE
ncbi:helix-turn-helix domain-containing protein [Paenibacillus sp. R14(2021)]|uniref:response regulator transcription factor n=1 Tax=Paenibacillus sp. R14(2021) TaxID=2859228 RepID=UPI001C6155EB|nr:helix-turn-helix domain-containing protein [Paenibacillus sp. R14(2021)]